MKEKPNRENQQKRQPQRPENRPRWLSPADKVVDALQGAQAWRSGPTPVAQDAPDRQTAEIQIRIALVNCFNALGTAEIVRVA